MIIAGLACVSVPVLAQDTEEVAEERGSDTFGVQVEAVTDWCYSMLDSATFAWMLRDVRAAEYWTSQAAKAIQDSATYHVYSITQDLISMAKGVRPSSNQNILNAISYLEKVDNPRAKRGLIMAYNAAGQYEMSFGRARAVQMFVKMADVAQSSGYRRMLTFSLYCQSEAYLRANMYNQAVQKAREVLQRDGTELLNFISGLQMVKIYSIHKANEMAETYLRRIEKDAFYEESYNLKSKYYLEKIDHLMCERKFDEAKFYSDLLVELRQLVSTPLMDWMCAVQRAKLLSLLGMVDESDEWIRRSDEVLSVSEWFVSDGRYSRSALLLAKANNELLRGKLKEAKAILDAIPTPSSLMHQSDFADPYFVCYERLYIASKQYQLAADNLNYHNMLRDTLANMHTKAREDDFVSIFQTDPTIIKQKTEMSRKAKDARLLQSQYTMLVFFTLFLALVLLIVLGVRRRRLQKADEALAMSLQKKLQEEVNAQTIELRKRNDLISLRNIEILNSQTYAKRIQQGLLPSQEKLLRPGWFSGAFIILKPFEIISGDFYWYSKIDSRIIICMGDGVGNGIPGAMMSMVGLALINDVVHRNGSTASASFMLSKINERIVEMMPNLNKHNDINMTVIVYDTEAGLFNASSANQSILYTQGGKVYPVFSTRKEDSEERVFYEDSYAQLYKGDSIYIYTDGLTSMINGQTMQMLKMSGLSDIISNTIGMGIEESQTYIRQQLNAWKGTGVQTDDILLMGLTI
ncbi:MAG: SpoIIE family protein phosphatase [Bacteroidales bacterium]|nr:SpoIIE family protein phosphatase [Bacteroidales bacterium]